MPKIRDEDIEGIDFDEPEEAEYEKALKVANEVIAGLNLEYPGKITFAGPVYEDISAAMRVGGLSQELSGRVLIAIGLAVIDRRSQVTGEDWHWAGLLWENEELRKSLIYGLRRLRRRR